MPKRIDSLATLPVFFKLDGQKVLIFGGSKAACWKAELLAAAGAEIHIYATNLEPEFSKLIEAQDYKGTFHHHDNGSAITLHELKSVSLVICDSEITELKTIYQKVKSIGTPLNVIDKPALCDFQFGSIVNRSPVVVSISTNGAAPILGQAIRQKIEALLPKSVSRWSALATTIRGTVNARLKPGLERRNFWQDFTKRAFSTSPENSSATQLINSISKGQVNPNQGQGRMRELRVHPKDAELLTLRDIRILQAADVIFHDQHIDQSVLELARREVEHVSITETVSKREQSINSEMKALAQNGKNVVRMRANNVLHFDRAWA